MTVSRKDLSLILANNPELILVDDWDLGRNPIIAGATPRMTEYEMQKKVFEECDRRALANPDWGYVIAVPNGQYRQGQRMEAGLKSGFPDIICLVPRWHANVFRPGAMVELKRTPNKPTVDQDDWLRKLRVKGFVCEVIYDDPNKVIEFLEWWIES